MRSMHKALIALMFAVPTAYADSGPGCGIGSMIFKGQTGLLPHTSAATTNGSSSNQLFGISSNSLGCDGSNVVNNEYQRKVFVAANLDNLNQEIAQGQGDHLAVLATLMGIANSDRSAFYTLAQDRYALIASAGDSADAFYQALIGAN